MVCAMKDIVGIGAGVIETGMPEITGGVASGDRSVLASGATGRTAGSPIAIIVAPIGMFIMGSMGEDSVVFHPHPERKPLFQPIGMWLAALNEPFIPGLSIVYCPWND